ncbi:hypothetical protein VPNG_05535 [Cytospora leucostoma]|uniref:Fork-head domain-containing protein n=1 Tax=Cytospora leucostoma TaxID=1230097 RepID=A0A423XBL2_9PEZI|nr:hypothetical protein VPNG_05535 [Cytospora leucostoma]
MTSSQDQDGPGLDGHRGTSQPTGSGDDQPIPNDSNASAPLRQQQKPEEQQEKPQEEERAQDQAQGQGQDQGQEKARPRSAADGNHETDEAAVKDAPTPQGKPPPPAADEQDTMGDAVQTWLESQPPPSQLSQPQADEDASASQTVPIAQSHEEVLPQQDGWNADGTLVPDEMHMAATNLLLGSQAMAPNLALQYLPYQLPVSGMNYNLGYAPDNVADMDADSDDGDSIFDASRFPRMPRLRFEDSVFQFTTNTVIIGRDQAAYKRALAARKRAEKGLPPDDEAREPHGNYSKSYISQTGGALGPESDGEEKPRPSKRRKTTIKDPPEDEPRVAAGTNGHTVHGNVISSRQYVDHTPGAVPVDIDALRPSLNDIAKVQIHGPGPDIIATTKGISREHLKIQYNQHERVWQAFPLGRNGFFCEDVLYGKNDVVNLRSGDELQIQSVTFIFDINGVEDGLFGNEGPRTYSEGGKEMSFDFQSSRGDENMRDTSESLPSDPVEVKQDESDEDADEDIEEEPASPRTAGREDDDDGEAEEDIRETVESDPPESRDVSKEGSMSANPEVSQFLVPPKKRGPGRPPKNGIMSKREERELKKKAQEEAKKNAPPQEPGEPPIKRKVGRPRKHPLPEDAEDQPEKRKYKPRKPKTEDGEGEDDPDGEKADKHKRLQKPKTPPLDLGDVKDWPEEKLQKPNKNYQLLIDEVLSAAPDGLTLKQIYKRIAKAYPYFHFKCDSKGWESSVRHNLIGSHCFQKNNETHLWKRVEGIPLDAGKKRKPSDSATETRPSPMYNGGYNHAYQQAPHPQQYPNHQMAQMAGPPHANLPPRYPPNGQAYQVPAPNPIQPGAIPHQQAAVRPGFPPHPPPATVPQANGYAAANTTPRPQYTGNQPPTYNSTYNNRPQSTPLANVGVAGFPAAQNHAQQSLVARSGQSAPGIPQSSHPIINTGATQHPQRAISSPHQQPQPVSNIAPPAPLGPVIDPSLRDFIKSFAREVVKQLQNRVGRPEAVAVSVVNRGLGLTKKSLTPEAESYEKAILNIFQAHKLTYSKPKVASASTTATPHTATAPSSITPAAAGRGNGAAPVGGPMPTPPTPTSATAAPAVNGSTGAASQASASGPVEESSVTGAASSTTTTGAVIPDPARAGSSTPNAANLPAATTATATAAASTTVGPPTNPAAPDVAVSSPVAAPAASGLTPNRSSATPAPTLAPGSGTSTTGASKDVQLLDPKLVELVQQYKKLSMEIIIPRVGLARGEILIMSAINRVLGFTDESIMSYKGEKNKEHLVEAEKALMQSLKHRIDTYLRCRRVSAAPTPVPVPR